MKIMRRICVLFAAILFATSALAEETTLRFVIGEWLPYTGEKAANYGMASEVVSAACKAAGLTAEYDFAPWKRAEHNVLTAKNFGTFPYKAIESRMDKFLFSDTLFSNSFGIVMKKDNPKTAGFTYRKPEDFKNFRVGIIAGTDAIKNALKAVGLDVEEVQGAKQNLNKLEAGRIDFYIDDKAVIYQAITENYPGEKAGEFVFADNGFGETNDWKIMVGRDYPGAADILAKINNGLAKLKESGEFDAILKKYGI